MDERILNKIKKCLALSQSSNPNEAATALRQAQKLMEAYNVSSMDLSRAEIGEAEIKSKASVSRIKDWELALLSTVAKAFGCRLMWMKSYSHDADVFGRYTLVGLKDQVWMAHYTAEVLQRKLMKARAEFVKALGPMGRWHKVREADGFCTGWVHAIKKTVQEFAMPPETKKLIDEVVERQTGGRDAKVQNRDKGSLGVEAGYIAGKGESIHRPLSERDPMKKLTKD
jgi:hypothetical protein